MNKTFRLLFFLKKSKVDAKGNSPIYLRITIEGKSAIKLYNEVRLHLSLDFKTLNMVYKLSA